MIYKGVLNKLNFIKIVLAIIGLLVAVMLGFWLIGLVSTILWYLFLFGIVAVGGAVGYKFLTKEKETPQLQEKTPIGIAEMDRADRTLEEYKRKYLSK